MNYRRLITLTAFSSLCGVLCSPMAFSMGKSGPKVPLEQRCPGILTASRNPDSKLARELQYTKEDLLACQLRDSEQRRKEEELKQEEERQRREAEDRQRQDAERSLQDYITWASKFVLGWQQSRCETFGDNVNQGPEAQGRTAWAKKCTQARIDEFGRKNDAVSVAKFQRLSFEMMMLNNWANSVGPSGRVYYPTYGIPDYKNGADPTNPRHYRAPTDPNAPCDKDASGNSIGIPDDYVMVAFCTAGCFSPDQELLYADGYHSIFDAYASSMRSIVTLSNLSTLEHPSYQVSELETYTRDLVEGWHVIVDLKTLSGKTLSITENHPLLISTGELRQANELKTGDFLVQTDGNPDPIVELNSRNYFGRVYNVRVSNMGLKENIIVAQGLLSGTAYFQNEGVKFLNRSLFRANLKDPISNQ